MKRRLIISGTMAVVLLGLPQVSFAWSAWEWTSKNTPLDLLPWMLVLAAIIETMVIYRCTKTDFKQTVCVMGLVNCLCLAGPYMLEWIMGNLSAGADVVQWRQYNISWGYGILTLAAEMPIVYHRFKDLLERRKLLACILEANILTTAIIFLIERIVCEGAWLSM